MTHTVVRPVESPVGTLTLVASDTGLANVLWPGEPTDNAAVFAAHRVLDAAEDQMHAYFAGERTTFDLPLDLDGTEFQVRTWRALAEIPFGETTTYAELAGRVGSVGAARAVGAANARNPVPIVLPCHRVVGSDGKLVGFAGGVDTKRFLLEHEQHVMIGDAG